MSVARHLLLLVLVPLCIYAVATAYIRFVVAEDYIVEYEGECDPITESCFVGCADDACTEVYYHTWVQKESSDVHAACGVSVLECETASVCLPGDANCSVRYCDADTALEDEFCDTLDVSSVEEAPEGEESLEEETSAEEPEQEMIPV